MLQWVSLHNDDAASVSGWTRAEAWADICSLCRYLPSQATKMLFHSTFSPHPLGPTELCGLFFFFCIMLLTFEPFSFLLWSIWCPESRRWQDRKKNGADGLTVNARRIIKICEWLWIITSWAHLDMQGGGNLLWKTNSFWEWLYFFLSSCWRWGLGSCVKFRLCFQLMGAEWASQHLFCPVFVRRFRSPTCPASRGQLLSNKEAALLIINELTLGLMMWIRKPRVDAASKASRSLALLRSGWTNRYPKEGWGWMLWRGFWGLWGFKVGGPQASLKLSFGEQGN